MEIAHATSALERAMEVNGRKLSPVVAREFLAWHLSEQDSRRIDELGAKNLAGGLSEEEMIELGHLCSTVDLIAIFHLLAKEALGELPGA